MLDIIRDSTVGQLVNFFSDGRLLPYPEQKPGFVLSAQFVLPNSGASSSLSDSDDAKKSKTFEPDEALSREDTFVVGEKEAGTKLDAPSDPRLVGWYSNDDQDNPRNWSASKRAFVAVCISLMTFTMYIGSAIYTPSIPGIRDYLNISLPHATLGLTLYILGYGIGPMFLSPLQELPRLGRNTVYMVSFVLFIAAFQIPILTANNIQTILACRFFTGIFGSPALATGGASMGDIYPFHQLPYVLGIWGIGAVGGPIAGPVVGGFAAQANTYEPTVLLRRAQRLRKLTGNNQLMSQAERNTRGESAGEVIKETLLRPFILATEPMLLFANVYIGFLYIFYLWFEAFPLVFTDIYHFDLGISGLPFTGFLVSGAITYTAYALYLMYHLEPRMARAAAEGKQLPPESRLEMGLMASIFIPTSLFMFGWASRASVHWIVPIIGAALYLPGIFLSFQSILVYMTFAYPM